MAQASVHETWSSRPAFILAAVGAAVGLGNIWRFPFIAGQNGGGAFVLVYIGFVLLLGIPIITAELAMGRRGQQSAVVTMSKLAREENSSQGWQVYKPENDPLLHRFLSPIHGPGPIGIRPAFGAQRDVSRRREFD